MHDTHLTITALILLLLIASGVAMITKWVPVPYTVALVVVGLVTSQLHFLPTIHISPELILLIFLPALLFEASWNLNLKALLCSWYTDAHNPPFILRQNRTGLHPVRGFLS